MKKSRLAILAWWATALPLAAQDPDWMRNWEAAQRERPAHISAQSRIAPPEEPGEPLVLHGRVFAPDGVTPVPGAVVFAYQTDAKGLYHEAAKHRWRLRGWARTNEKGAFEFTTIRPAPYPAGNVPAHVHLTIEGNGVPQQWTEELRFDDDSLISASERERSQKAGMFGQVRPVRREGKVQHVEFNLRAKREADF